jgi:chitin disaccharide deacetylase
MVGAPAAWDAVERARSRPALPVGLHVTLVHGPALLPHDELPHLADARGWLSFHPMAAGLRCTLLPACRAELRREAEAQFKAFDGLGLGWSHVDTHLHFGLTPVVFSLLVDLCRKYRVPGYRVPEDDFGLYRRIDPADAARQRLLALHFSTLCLSQRRRAEQAGLQTTRWCYGLFRSGRLDVDYLERLVGEMPDADLELHCHPDLSTETGRVEFEALRSPRFRRALERRGVILSTYKSLREGVGR